MKSATHINTLPVRPDLFGRKMNATTHHKQPQYVIASDCHVSISLSTLTYANFSSRQMLVALHQFKHLILYQLLLNNTVLYLMLFFIRWPGQILYKNRQFYFLTKLIKPQSQDGQLNHWTVPKSLQFFLPFATLTRLIMMKQQHYFHCDNSKLAPLYLRT